MSGTGIRNVRYWHSRAGCVDLLCTASLPSARWPSSWPSSWSCCSVVLGGTDALALLLLYQLLLRAKEGAPGASAAVGVGVRELEVKGQTESRAHQLGQAVVNRSATASASAGLSEPYEIRRCRLSQGSPALGGAQRGGEQLGAPESWREASL
eukprot:CAMPEP_0177718480 /NCGR_PEP_ID=MMETSP0484_2-20121128/15600_1 /TAXON_ID=354590 /ORGANISM="Rhodomonas lens, Strain RHODO" /LENGTH=152 /DNA_ID=CAMNT_0019230649 /DNA_START=115 /DNA_END=574 /DNA_ORIENTATION=+